MKTLTLEEATSGLGRWVDLALAGEKIQIRKGDQFVELRPMEASKRTRPATLSPREALRCLQEEARLTADEASRYLEDVRAERLACEERFDWPPLPPGARMLSMP